MLDAHTIAYQGLKRCKGYLRMGGGREGGDEEGGGGEEGKRGGEEVW